jgi:hypothetical protein
MAVCPGGNIEDNAVAENQQLRNSFAQEYSEGLRNLHEREHSAGQLALGSARRAGLELFFRKER